MDTWTLTSAMTSPRGSPPGAPDAGELTPPPAGAVDSRPHGLASVSRGVRGNGAVVQRPNGRDRDDGDGIVVGVAVLDDDVRRRKRSGIDRPVELDDEAVDAAHAVGGERAVVRRRLAGLRVGRVFVGVG